MRYLEKEVEIIQDFLAYSLILIKLVGGMFGKVT